MTKFGKISIFGTLAIIIAVAVIGLVWFLNPERKIDNEVRDTIERQEVGKVKAVEALYSLVAVADSVSGIKSLGASKFEVVDMNGRSANFGISQSDGVRSEDIVEENMIIFQSLPMDENFPKTYNSEVDIASNKVVSMHREPIYSGDKKSADELEKIARQFVEKVMTDFVWTRQRILSTLSSESGNKGDNYFFRWDDKQFTVPNRLEMDLPPFIQVGITSSGYIFSYNNTVPLYYNKSTLKALCQFVEIPLGIDDSVRVPEEGIVMVGGFVLPYEPETDFEGCSESAKIYLRHLPNDPDKN